jgi:hypothetical protein
MHNYFRQQGFDKVHNKYDAARAKWAALSEAERKHHIIEGMRRAQIPEDMIADQLDDVLKGDTTPGRKQPRKYTSVDNKICKEVINEAREKAAKELAEKVAQKVAKKLGKAAPVAGAAIVLFVWAEEAEAKGPVAATANAILDAIPYLGGLKTLAELANGRDLIPDRGQPSLIQPDDPSRPAADGMSYDGRRLYRARP